CYSARNSQKSARGQQVYALQAQDLRRALPHRRERSGHRGGHSAPQAGAARRACDGGRARCQPRSPAHPVLVRERRRARAARSYAVPLRPASRTRLREPRPRLRRLEPQPSRHRERRCDTRDRARPCRARACRRTVRRSVPRRHSPRPCPRIARVRTLGRDGALSAGRADRRGARAPRGRRHGVSRAPSPDVRGDEAPVAEPSASPRPLVPRWRWLPLGVGLATVGAVAGGALLTRSHARPVLDPNLVAVAPFDVLDARFELWHEGLVDYLSKSFDGAGPLRTVSPTVVLRRWHGPADPTSASELG